MGEDKDKGNDWDSDDLYKLILKTDWEHMMSDDHSVRERGYAEVANTRTAIQAAAKQNPEKMEELIERISEEHPFLVDEVRQSCRSERTDKISWHGKDYTSDSTLAQLKKFDTALKAAPRDEWLPLEEYKKLRSWIGTKEQEKESAVIRNEAKEITEVRGLTADSDYLKLAEFIAKSDRTKSIDEFRAVYGWAKEKWTALLEAKEKEDLLKGQDDIVRGVVTRIVEVAHRFDDLSDLKKMRDTCEMTKSQRQKLESWIDEKERREESRKETAEERHIRSLEAMEPSTPEEKESRDRLIAYYMHVNTELKAGRDPLEAEKNRDEEKTVKSKSVFLDKLRARKDKEQEKER